jgi:hypothetical protein
MQAENISKTTAIVITNHCISSCLNYKAAMMRIAILYQKESLICTLTQQGSLAVPQVVLSFLLSLLVYAF